MRVANDLAVEHAYRLVRAIERVIDERRRKLGLSWREVGRRMGDSEPCSVAYRWHHIIHKGRRIDMHLDTLISMARALDTSAAKIFAKAIERAE